MSELKDLLQIWDLEANDTSFLTIPRATSITTVSHQKICTGCHELNARDANWCIECGLAFIGNSDLSKDEELDSYQETQLNAHYLPRTKRNWKTSNFYSWRKPSSISVSSPAPASLEPEYEATPAQHAPQTTLTADTVPCVDVTSSAPISKKSSDIKHFPTGNNIILNCPSEILLLVFSYLKHSDLYNCMFVCRLFYCIAKDHTLWKTISLRKVKSISKVMMQYITLMSPYHLKLVDCKGKLGRTDIIRFFEHTGRQLKSLTIETSDFGYYSCDIILLTAAKYCKQLSSLSIDWIAVSEETLSKTIHLCGRLERLCINHPTVTSSTLQALAVHHCTWLRSLEFESTSVTEIFLAIEDKILSTLESFSAAFNVLNSCVVKRLRHIFPNLSVLNVHCTSSSEIQMESSLRELSNMHLTILGLQKFERNSLDILSCSILSQMISLRHLKVDCLSDEEVKVLCQGNLLLQTLDLSKSFVTEKCLTLVHGSSFSSLLKCLKLNYCDGINDAAVKRTIESFSTSWRGKTVAQEIIDFIRSSPRLATIELNGIHCACDVEVASCTIYR